MKNTLTFVALGLACAASAEPAKLQWSPLTLGSLSAYTKLKSNFRGLWQQETGLSARFLTDGRLSLGGNVAWLDNYPIESPYPANWTAGLTLAYRTAPSAYAPSIYTKIKSNLVGVTQQETGFSALLVRGHGWGLGGNVAYVFNYPYKSTSFPAWTGGLTVSIPLSSR